MSIPQPSVHSHRQGKPPLKLHQHLAGASPEGWCSTRAALQEQDDRNLGCAFTHVCVFCPPRGTAAADSGNKEPQPGSHCICTSPGCQAPKTPKYSHFFSQSTHHHPHQLLPLQRKDRKAGLEGPVHRGAFPGCLKGNVTKTGSLSEAKAEPEAWLHPPAPLAAKLLLSFLLSLFSNRKGWGEGSPPQSHPGRSGGTPGSAQPFQQLPATSWTENHGRGQRRRSRGWRAAEQPWVPLFQKRAAEQGQALVPSLAGGTKDWGKGRLQHPAGGRGWGFAASCIP